MRDDTAKLAEALTVLDRVREDLDADRWPWKHAIGLDEGGFIRVEVFDRTSPRRRGVAKFSMLEVRRSNVSLTEMLNTYADDAPLATVLKSPGGG